MLECFLSVGLFSNKISLLIRTHTRNEVFLLPPREQKEMVATYKLERKPLSGTQLAGTLILDFPTSRTVRNSLVFAIQSVTFCCKSSSRLMQHYLQYI
jgi:hypothetical protein